MTDPVLISSTIISNPSSTRRKTPKYVKGAVHTASSCEFIYCFEWILYIEFFIIKSLDIMVGGRHQSMLKVQCTGLLFSIFKIDLFVFNWGGMKPRLAVSDQGSSAKPHLMLTWVTNVWTSPDLYIEFSTEY